MSPPVVVNIQPDDSGSRVWDQAVQRGLVTESQSALQQPNGPAPFKLTIVVPVFNEEHTSAKCSKLSSPSQFLVTSRSSSWTTDRRTGPRTCSRPAGTTGTCASARDQPGQGCRRSNWHLLATGTHLLVFDADSEYDPDDIPKLIAPILSGRAEVVYGVRVRGAGALFPSFINVLGNRLMTAAANLLYGSAITDLHTCLKLLPMPMLRLMQLEEEGFGLDTEISAEMLRRGFRPFEIPVSYVGGPRGGEEDSLVRRLSLPAGAAQGSATRTHAIRDTGQVDRSPCVGGGVVGSGNAVGPLSRGGSRALHA